MTGTYWICTVQWQFPGSSQGEKLLSLLCSLAQDHSHLTSLDRSHLTSSDRSQLTGSDRSHIAGWDRSELASSDRSQLGMLDHYTIYNPAFGSPAELFSCLNS